MATAHGQVGGVTLTYEPDEPSVTEAWVLRSYAPDGACVVKEEGAAAVTITG